MGLDGADGRVVTEALCGWLAERFGREVDAAEESSSNVDGFDNWIHFVRFTGPELPNEWRQPLVARVHRDADRLAIAETEARIQEWCSAVGYPCPRVLAVIPPGAVLDTPIQIMERAPGTSMLDAIRRRPWHTPRLIRQLAGLQVALHELDPSGWPDPDRSSLDRRLSLVRRVVAETSNDEIASALEQVEQLEPKLSGAPQVVCHGDLHPLNVVVDGESAAVIDWTDAGLGDRHSDVARTKLLFRVAAIAAQSQIEKAVLRTVGPRMARGFTAAYERIAPLDPHRLRLWEPVHLLHGWSQVVASHAGLFDDDVANRDERISSDLGDQLRSWFHTAVAAAA